MTSGENRNLNRFIRRTIYSLKRQYGGRVDIYKLVDTSTDYETGVKNCVCTVSAVMRCIVLPTKIHREAVQTISSISANKTFVYGGTFDTGTRTFIIDARDLAPGYTFALDDWILYSGRRYEIKSVAEYEQHTAWEIVGKEVVGVLPEKAISVNVSESLSLDEEADNEL